MNPHRKPMNGDEPAVNGRTLERSGSGEMEYSGPIYDGELVEDGLPTRPVEPRGRWASWWQRSPRVPVWLKSKTQARQTLKDAPVAVLRSPWRYLGSVARGLVTGARTWRQWVTVHDYREAAEEAAKLADKPRSAH